jgi:hypothetical protein
MLPSSLTTVSSGAQFQSFSSQSVRSDFGQTIKTFPISPDLMSSLTAMIAWMDLPSITLLSKYCVFSFPRLGWVHETHPLKCQALERECKAIS